MRELEELAELLLGAYALTGKLLSLLPIPILLPPLEETGGLNGAQALERARVAIHDLPLDPHVVATLDHMIFEWLIARDLCTLAVSISPDPHRIHGLRAALARFSEISERAERLLTLPGQGL
ncbi:hypothetical protein [Nonomuraea turcica]|uniref:hypothetical protein n=1 Tax=Nonomuraea sp. G32 TaxID=3067274 RepID=UPI00273B2DEA|nr:hypothetical protein [Nonomuraea sp. G32]MDP4510342.1 hypothetical protein [Nonomuraea sp. G32]